MQELNDPCFLEDLIEETDGVPVEYQSESTWGHFGQIDELDFEGAKVVGVESFVKVPTGRLPDVRVDEQITVDERLYTVRGHQRFDDGGEEAFASDGALTVIFLAVIPS